VVVVSGGRVVVVGPCVVAVFGGLAVFPAAMAFAGFVVVVAAGAGGGGVGRGAVGGGDVAGGVVVGVGAGGGGGGGGGGWVGCVVGGGLPSSVTWTTPDIPCPPAPPWKRQ
jgi:hypothetical protein